MNLDPRAAQDQITALLLAHPELEEDEVLRADCIEGQMTVPEFLAMIVRMIGSTKAVADGTAAYIEELQQRRQRLERRSHALRSLIFKVMNTAELRKMELPEATLSVRHGQQQLVITNEHEIPEEFFRVKREPDRTRLKAALKAHEHVPGAALSNAEPTLAILVK